MYSFHTTHLREPTHSRKLRWQCALRLRALAKQVSTWAWPALHPHPWRQRWYAGAYKSITNRNVFIYTNNKRSTCIGKLARNLSLGTSPRRIKPEDHHAYWQLSNRRSVSVHFSPVNLRPYYDWSKVWTKRHLCVVKLMVFWAGILVSTKIS